MKIYYLFSKSNSLEAIYICKQEKSIETPARKTDVYPLGTIFSKVIQLLSVYDEAKQDTRLISCYETLDLQFECLCQTSQVDIEELFKEHEIRNLNRLANAEHLNPEEFRYHSIKEYKERHKKFKSQKEIEIKLKKSTDGACSFSSVVNDDLTVRIVLEILLKNDRRFLQPVRNHVEVINLLKDYFEYIKVCQTNKQIASLNAFEAFSMLHNVELPQRTLYIPAELYKKYDTPQKRIENIEELLSDVNKKGTEFDKKIPQHSKILPTIQDQPPKNSSPQKLSTPIYIYEINDVIDLILVSLQCIYGNNYVLSRCAHCKELFVTHNRSMKYCPNYSQKTSCQLKAKGLRRAEEERNDTCKSTRKTINARFLGRITTIKNKRNDKLSESQKDKMEVRLQYLEEKHRIFKQECRAHKTKTDKELITWMNSYWDDTLANLPKY